VELPARQNMSKADWDFVAGMGKTLESLWPEKLAMSRRLGNTNPEKIAPRPFDTPHGRYEGWYWPMIYDPARAQDVAERGAKAGDCLFENIYSRANTDTGRMNTRNENYARPLLLSLDVIPRVIKDEIHDIAYREAIIDADKFLTHPSCGSPSRRAEPAALRPAAPVAAVDRERPQDDRGHAGAEVVRRARARRAHARDHRRPGLPDLDHAGARQLGRAGVGRRGGPGLVRQGPSRLRQPDAVGANKDFVFERSGEMRNRMNEVDRDVREHLREIDLRLMDTDDRRGRARHRPDEGTRLPGHRRLDMASALADLDGGLPQGDGAVAQGGKGL
jgi:hypothetical protein